MELIYSKLINNASTTGAANASLSPQALLSNAASSIFLQSAQKYHNGHSHSNNNNSHNHHHHHHHHHHHNNNHSQANIKYINSNRIMSPLLMLNGSTDVHQDEIANELINSQRHNHHHNNLHLGSTYEDDYEEDENELSIGGQHKPQKQKPKNNMTMTSAVISNSSINGNGHVKHNFIEHEDSCDSSIVGDLASVTSATDDNDLFMIQTINSSLTDLAASSNGSMSMAIANRQQQLNLNRRDNQIHTTSHNHHHHHHHHHHLNNSANFDDTPSGNNTSSNIIEDLLLNAANSGDNLTFNGSDVAAGDGENKFDLLYSKSSGNNTVACVKSLGSHKNGSTNPHDDDQANDGHHDLEDNDLNFANTILINSNQKNAHMRFGACNGESEDDASQDLISTELLLPEQNSKKFTESNDTDLDIGLIDRPNDDSTYSSHQAGQHELLDTFDTCKSGNTRENYKHNLSSLSRSQIAEPSSIQFGLVSLGNGQSTSSSLPSSSSSNSSLSCSSSSGISINYVNGHQADLASNLNSTQSSIISSSNNNNNNSNSNSQAKCFLSQKQISTQGKTSMNKSSNQIAKKDNLISSSAPLSLSSSSLSSLSSSSSGYETVNLIIDLKNQTTPRQQPQQIKPKSKKKSSSPSHSQSTVGGSINSPVLTNEKINCKSTNNNPVAIQQNSSIVKSSKSYSKPSTIASLVNMNNSNNSSISNNSQQANASIMNNLQNSLNNNNSANTNKRQRTNIQPLTSKITQQLIDFQSSNSASSTHFQLNVLCTGKRVFFCFNSLSLFSLNSKLN
jgi:hypothetical protein